MKRISISWFLFIGFVLSVIYAAVSISHKIKDFGFSLNPNSNANVWLVEGKISFETTDEPIKLVLTAPNIKAILEDSITADGYTVDEKRLKDKKIITLTKELNKKQPEETIYYRLLLLENIKNDYILHEKPGKVEKPYFDDAQIESAKKIIEFAKSIQNNNDFITNLIMVLNNKPSIPEVKTFIPLKVDQKMLFDITKSLLALENIPVNMLQGLKLMEGKSMQKPDLLLEAFVNNEWKVYNLENGSIGIPNDFLVFQHGGDSLLDVEGGKNSRILFSVLKNKYNTLFLSKYKAESTSTEKSFEYSMYNLPIREQNILKIMAVFPLAILAIVILRNIIGIKTLGTFTPLLIAMAFIETGFLYGIISFSILIAMGFLIRKIFSRLNLLLVPRISAVVILVIFLIQISTIISYNLNIKLGLSLIFFPLIITAWIIERSTILMEESGEKEAIKQNVYTLLAAAFTYFMISSEEIRYIMYVFNELNICILFLVMWIGTYTGYRLTELFRFKSLVEKND